MSFILRHYTPIAVLATVAILFALFVPQQPPIASFEREPQGTSSTTPTRTSAATSSTPSTSTTTSSEATKASTTPKQSSKATTTIKQASPNPPKKPQASKTTSSSSTTAPAPTSSNTGGIVTRLEHPYPFDPYSFDSINNTSRQALVNILCSSNGSLRPITGSGIIISPKGVILTNAHVAQYVLLSQAQGINLTCTIRTGSPARDAWHAVVLYIPPVWVREHAQDITNAHALGTGEHDYALLYITMSATGDPLPHTFPFVPLDTREGIAFQDDQVYVASYPAEFVGGLTAHNMLYGQSSITNIKQLLTYAENSIDAFALGGVIVAQGGSSGGAVINAWGRLVGMITTTTEGSTTADRNLRAVSTSYINRDIKAQSGSELELMLSGDLPSKVADFTSNTAPDLLTLYLAHLKR